MKIRHIKVCHGFEAKCQCGWKVEVIFRSQGEEAAEEHIELIDGTGERPNAEHTVTLTEFNRIGRNL